jgi:hypothetical protein
MQNLYAHLRTYQLPYSVIFFGALIQLYLVAQPMSFLLVNILPDDAFYYFEIARNVAQGLGSTFDGTNATNGYHPLWLVLLIGVYSIVQNFSQDGDLPIRIALMTSVILNVSSAAVFYHVLRRYVVDIRLSTIALAAWVLNPFVLYETINGLETSLSLFFLTIFISLALRYKDSFANRELVILGIVAGLMILARVDLVFYFIAFLLWFSFTKGIWESRFKVLLVGLWASVLVIPWLLWNKLGFGMWLTSASAGNAFVNQTLTHQSGVGPLYEAKHILHHLVHQGENVLTTTGMPILFLVAFGVLLGMLVQRLPSLQEFKLRSLPIESAFIFGFVLLFVADAGIRFVGRSWYFISFNLFLALTFAIVLPYLVRHAGKYKEYLLGGVILIALGSFAIMWYSDLQGRMQNQLTIYEAAMWSNDNLPKGAVVGAFNAGILGYYGGYTVINLDGLVNNEALIALKEKKLWQYIEEEGITHFIEGRYYFTNRYAPFLGVTDLLFRLNEGKSFAIPGEGKAGSVSVFQVQ